MSRFSQFARNLFADETLYPRANVARPMSDFRENYRGATASEQNVDQYDVKFDWNASANDKLYVRYSRQTADSGTSQTIMPLSFASASDNPFWGVATNWNRIFGNSVVNDLLIGYSDGSSLSIPLDPLGLGELNNRLGIAGDQVMRGLTNIRWGNDLTANRQRRNRHRQCQPELPGQRAADVAARPALLEVRRLLELLAQQVALSRQQWPQRVHRLRRVQFHGRAVCRLPARSGVAEGPRLGDGGVDAPAASHRPLRRG